jgi:protein-disulfide isomerase
MSNEEEVKVSRKQLKGEARRNKRQKQERSRQLRNLFFILIGAGVIAAAMIYQSSKPVSGLIKPEAREYYMADFNSMGSPDAQMVIEEIGDFQCPSCLNFFETVEGALINTGLIEANLIRYVYRSAGEFLGPESANAAEAAYCAGDQDKFWEMHDAIYNNFSNGNSGGYSDKRLVGMAELIGADGGDLQACLDSDKYLEQIAADQEYATAEVGIRGTPSIVINGVLYDGDLSFQAIQNEIQAQLSQ